jgi:hypothetical protein
MTSAGAFASAFVTSASTTGVTQAGAGWYKGTSLAKAGDAAIAKTETKVARKNTRNSPLRS